MAPMMIAVVWRSHMRVDMPKPVPAAGGCSVSLTAIRIISGPTDMASARSRIGRCRRARLRSLQAAGEV